MPQQDTPELTLPLIRKHLYTAVLSDALDALGYPHQCPRLPLRPLTGFERLAGRCKTTLWADMFHVDPQPYELELRAVDTCQPDDVLIAAAGGSRRSGIWGELLSTAARNRGCVGVLVDGAARDVDKMTAMGFPCWALGTSPYDRRRQRVVDLDVPVELDGVVFSPGDLVMADLDGVVVVPREVEREALTAAWTKVHAENEVRDAIRAGMLAAAAYQRYGVL